MAEIKVEKKNRPVWPWILGVLLLGAIIWIVVDDNDMQADEISTIQMADEADRYEADHTTESKIETEAAMAFVSFVEENSEKITLQHEYSHQALTHLSEALISVSRDASSETKQKVDMLKQKADELKKNTYSDEHADIMAKAFTAAANALESMQEERFPGLESEISQVRNAANNMNPKELATNQKETIRTFFEESADAVEAMVENV